MNAARRTAKKKAGQGAPGEEEPLSPGAQQAQDKLMELVKGGFDHRLTVENGDLAGRSQPPATARRPAPAEVPDPAAPPELPEVPDLTAPPKMPGMLGVPRTAGIVPGELLPMAEPRYAAKPVPKKQDPDYMATSTYMLRPLNQRGKIVAAQLGVDFADLINMALYSYLIDFEDGLQGNAPQNGEG